jgi:membrane protein DedA with SNARE-associated domain
MLHLLAALAAGTFVSEDLACVAAGLIVSEGRATYLAAVAACFAGIVAGDTALFFAGRYALQPVIRRAGLRHGDRLREAEAALRLRGMSAILFSRFLPGLRLAMYVAAGALGVPFGRFLPYFLLAAAVWTPLLVGLAALIGERAPGALSAAAIAAAAVAAARRLRNTQPARRLWGRVRRLWRWEFWPVWAAYLPLVPYLLFLAIRYRSVSVFTLVNPGIPGGGLTGESKSAILAHLDRGDGIVPAFQMIPAGVSEANVAPPVVLKPDRGERGRGVRIIRTQAELREALEATRGTDRILQDYVPGLEFGLFYLHDPREANGHVVSIVEKTFPWVTGDGRRTLADLILDDDRAACLYNTYRRECGRDFGDVPAAGERVPLVEVGSHCRGAVFNDRRDLITPALDAATDRIARRHPGFYLGRFDVRAESYSDLRQGCFRVLELNGVAAEPGHIYDPSVSLAGGYRALMVQWRAAFAIGAWHRRRGVHAMRWRELAQLWSA